MLVLNTKCSFLYMFIFCWFYCLHNVIIRVFDSKVLVNSTTCQYDQDLIIWLIHWSIILLFIYSPIFNVYVTNCRIFSCLKWEHDSRFIELHRIHDFICLTELTTIIINCSWSLCHFSYDKISWFFLLIKRIC
jgi:hypothetical protein